MSLRALRKLQGREVLTFPTIEDDETEDEVDESVNETSPVSQNIFSMLDDSDRNSNDEEDGTEVVAPSPKIENTNKNKKKKKKKKKKKPQKEDVENDIDKVLESINSPSDAASTSLNSIATNSSSNKSVLTIEHRLLNPENELRKIFGTRVLSGDSSYRRRNKPVSHKAWLIQPDSNWTKRGKVGLSMELINTAGNVSYFKFVHSKEYQDVQFLFLDAVESSNHHNIARVLEKNRFHVDSLLTFSDIYKIHDDLKMAREMVERAIYCLECSFHSCFNMTTGNCRLEYKYVENRCIFLLLFKHMKFVSQRACNRTALELCKFLLSLDPVEDPLGSIFYLDYFSVRSGEYQFLIKFVQEWGSDRNLNLLPNWAYSHALATYYVEKEDNIHSSTSSDDLIQDALINFPSVLLMLLDKCSVQPDTDVKESIFFGSQADETTPDGLAILCRIFVERNFTMWKASDVLSWLERNVKVVLKRISNKEECIDNATNRRKVVYQKPPINVYRHALISELPGVLPLLPPDIRMKTLMSHDPLPPADSIASYTRPERDPMEIVGNPVRLFFQSLLPGFNPEEQLEIAEAANQEGAAQDLRGNVRVLMEAMRDLLDNFNLPADENDQEEDVPLDGEWD